MTTELWRLTLAAIGLLLAFAGWTTFRAGLAATGFVLGAGTLLHAASRFPKDPSWLLPAAALAAGLAAALLVLFAWKVGISILGGTAFVLAALSIPGLVPTGPLRWLILVAVGLGGALLARFLEKIVISLGTALVGASLVTAAAAGPIAPLRIPRAPGIAESLEEPFLLVVFVVVAIVGATVQLRRPKRDD